AVIARDPAPVPTWVEIQTEETYWFWFRQRLLQYGKNVKLLSPKWLVKQLAAELRQTAQQY
ncbi:MAG: WYL domain-containing protein, partial [Leptolyngbya sp. SIO4C1]|nr:WYL domain-containing protein [Leptolyngbya sp. SIO4C1]